MRAVIVLTLSMLRRRKLQNLLTALLLLLSAVLLGTALTVLLNAENLFEDAHRETNGSHQILTLDQGLHDPEFVYRWWEDRPGVRVSKPLPYKNLSGLAHEGKDLPNLYLYMMDTPSLPFGVDEPLFSSDVPSAKVPAPGTVWIPTSLAASAGIFEGDTLGFRTPGGSFELTVSAVVVDVPYGSPFTTSARIWMNDADYRQELSAVEGGARFMMGLRFDDYGRQAEDWSAFEQALGSPYLETRTDFAEISAFYLILNRVIGFVMMFLGAVMAAIALATIGFTVSDALLTRYRTIGVLRSMGLTTAGIVAPYVLQYGAIALPSVAAGLLLSRLPAAAILDNTLASLHAGDAPTSLHGSGWVMLSGLFLVLFVLACAALYAGSARRILPAQAIRYGMAEQNQAGSRGRKPEGRSGLGRFPVGLALAAGSVAGGRRAAFFTGLIALVASSVLVFGILLLSSVLATGRTAGQWGYDASDVSVTVVSEPLLKRSDFIEKMKNDPRIERYGWYTGASAVLKSDDPSSAGSSMNVYLGLLDGGYDGLGYEVLEGRNPRGAGEIALGLNAARYAGRTVGDLVDLYVRGEKKTFTVTGIYQSVANMSHSARLTAEALPTASGANTADRTAFVSLRDAGDAKAVAEEWNAAYPNALSAASQASLIDAVFGEAVRSLLLPLGLMGVLFLAVTCLIVYSVCRIQVRKNSRTYGIYKSVGLSSLRIRRAVMLGATAVAAAGAASGALVGIYALPLLLNRILSGYGLERLPLVISLPGTAAAVLFSIAASAAGCWLSSRVVARTSPRILTID
ncbi:ABC transporter permease [Saccharibacillus alkalitolerans]|uniref:FtsX-like permease family protein n=1 Tax=Saccharibacillus alkalitolerans TaxID=2705290 RepID=A0ABX0F481_9BACL|nr:FtsX-like permease family protein [Saccharibacillus alkalitolerans]NGZ75788.1 FtsX-like permease family protein [Saccharibacillus alkalitolerans]